MPGEPIIYQRGVLYEEVWAEPMRTVAARCGVSDVALARTCRKLGVPVPGRGYWAKSKVGNAPERPPLPPLAEGEPESAHGYRWGPRSKPEPLEGLDAAAALTLPSPVVVPDEFDHPHKLVALSARYLQKAHPVDGVVSARASTCLDIAVSPACLDRALRIFDALIKALEAAGLAVEVTPVGESPPAPRPTYYDPHPEVEPRRLERVTRVLCDEEWIELRLNERVRRIEDKGPAPAEGSARGRERFYTYEPTGQLTLRLPNVTAPGVRTKWQESKQQRLEELLGEFIAYLPAAALSFTLQREAEERRAAEAREAEIRRYEEQRRRWDEEERRREEEKREEAFEAEVDRWRRAQGIRHYVAAALGALEQRGLSAEAEQTERERLAWALKLAERIDPLGKEGGAEDSRLDSME